MFTKELTDQPSDYPQELQEQATNLLKQALENRQNKRGITPNSRLSKNREFKITANPNSFTLIKHPGILNQKNRITLKKHDYWFKLTITPKALEEDYGYSHINGAEYDPDNGNLILYYGVDNQNPSMQVRGIIYNLICQAQESFK